MNEKTLWQKFYENGKIEDYLKYRNFINKAQTIDVNNMQNITELNTLDKDNGAGPCHKRTEYW